MQKTLILILLILPVFSFAQTKIAGIKALDSLNQNKNIQLLDVRTPLEFKEKHLKNALNMDWKDPIQFDSLVLFLDKSKPLYVYCRTGVRSAAAAKKLTELGFIVYDIQGGITQWEADRLPICRPEDY